MNHIILTPEQARIVRESEGAVEARDEQGRTVAHLTPLSPLDVDALERYRRSRGRPQPSIPGEQVQAHFRRLEETRQREGMDEAKALDILRRLRAGEEV